ncbi:MAG: hypothetical protein OXE49_02185, partial [Gemmatimonadetes bacterium]|nr:hypothetical protein [Gemmatimonadota bacterium]
LGEAFGAGNNGAICAHWASVNSDVWRDIIGTPKAEGRRAQAKKKKQKPLSSYETASKQRRTNLAILANRNQRGL